MKRQLCLILIVIFSMSIFGCGNSGQDSGSKISDVQNEVGSETEEPYVENDIPDEKITFQRVTRIPWKMLILRWMLLLVLI